MAALEGTVNVPVAGKLPKKELAIGGAAVGILIVVYYVRGRKSASSAATAAAGSASSSNQYPPDGTVGNPSDPYSTDPATSQTYGNEAAGSGGTYGAFGSLAGGQTGNYDPGTGMYYDPATGQYDLSAPYTGTTQPGSGGPPFSNNEAWSAYVLQQEQNLNPGANIGAWEDALGLYLNGQPVDASQKQIIFDAIAIGGDPPVAGANGSPPNVRTNGTKGPTPTKVRVPDEVGKQAETAIEAVQDAGFKVKVTPTRRPDFEYTVTSQDPKAGTDQNKGSTVTLHVKQGKAINGGPRPRK